MSSLFVAEPPVSVDSLLGLGILLPDDQGALATGGKGFINGDPARSVEWAVFREFDGSGTNGTTDFIETDGFELQRVSISSSTEVPVGAMIVSKENSPTCTTDVLLTINCGTIFDLATYQLAIWVSAACDVRFEGFMGYFDRDVHAKSRQRDWSEGDLVRYYVSGKPHIVGVAELVRQEKERQWIAKLHSCSSSDAIQQTDILCSQAQSTFEGVSARFECNFATVQSIC